MNNFKEEQENMFMALVTDLKSIAFQTSVRF